MKLLYLFTLTLASFFVISISTSYAQTCDYYAAPTVQGSGDHSSAANAGLISTVWSKVSAGNTLCLLDGTYTGANSMIDPPDGFSGTAANPITIRALNDGEAFIDGQDTRVPVHLFGNDYLILEGFNAANAAGGSVINIVTGADNNIIRRVVAWDAARDENVGFVIGNNNNTGNLFEDMAVFGTARKVIGSTFNGDDATFRRIWGRWEGSDFTGPKETLTAAYNNYNMTTENFIGTWSGEQMTGPTDQPFGVIATDNDGAFSKILGTIMYIRTSDNFPAGQVSFLQNVHDYELKDVVVYNEKTGINTLDLGSSADPTGLSASKITAIGDQPANINAIWNPTNIINATSVADANSQGANIFTGTSGAQVCYRYVDRVLTTTPLWPWPMNQRIIDAMTDAGYTPVDVTATIESIFGTIPAQCKTAAGTATVSTDNSTYEAGETITVTVDEGLSGLQEWIGLYVSTDLDSDLSFEENWQYLNGTKTQPVTPPTYPVILTFTAPTTPGTYNIRYFRENGTTNRMAISSDFTVTSLFFSAAPTNIATSAAANPSFAGAPTSIGTTAAANPTFAGTPGNVGTTAAANPTFANPPSSVGVAP